MIDVELLRLVDKQSLFIDATMLAVFFIIWIRGNRLSSTLISLGVIVLLDGFALHYKSVLIGLKDTGNDELVRFGWYMGYAFIDIAVLFCVYNIHLRSITPYSFITKMIFLEYCTYGIIQTVRYGERFIFQTDYLASIYKHGLLSINIATTAVTVVFTIIVAISIYRESKGKEGVKWRV
ncbi:MAG: hypothetical protein HRT35_18825 [Algicola sp.]|nr:hypothetical protein [Algicola sp.]